VEVVVEEEGEEEGEEDEVAAKDFETFIANEAALNNTFWEKSVSGCCSI
jgi:hypothetical protein